MRAHAARARAACGTTLVSMDNARPGPHRDNALAFDQPRIAGLEQLITSKQRGMIQPAERASEASSKVGILLY